MRSLTAAVLTGALTCGGVAALTPGATAVAGEPGRSATTPHVRGYQPPPIEWTRCTSKKMVAAGARCGLLTVPLDYHNLAGRKIKIGVSIIKHRSSQKAYQGVMLVNPGGPGGSGLNLARIGGLVPKHAGDVYDWIGFDPRGVGTSQPQLTCDGNYFSYHRPDYVPSTRTLERTWLTKAAGYAAACKKAGGGLLNYMKSTDNVNDMDTIRKAFGAERINYYGFSYGTYLGQLYATMHPDRVRRMVWDGVIGAKGVWYESNLHQDYAFERTMDAFLTWVAAHDSTYHLGTTQAQVKGVWRSMMTKARRAPFGGRIGPDEWTDAFLSAGYNVKHWPDTAAAFQAAVKGHYGPITTAFDDANGTGPGSDNGYAVYLATSCTDVQWPRSWDTWRRDSWRAHHKAPFETWSNTWFNAPCLTWGAPAPKKAPQIKDSGVPPVLMIEETNDAATPWAGAMQARSTFSRSVLIEGTGGTTHAGSLNGVACTDNRIADYLLTGRLDPRRPGRRSDVRCPPNPAPEPSGRGSSTAKAGAAQGTDRMPADLRQLILEAVHRG